MRDIHPPVERHTATAWAFALIMLYGGGTRPSHAQLEEIVVTAERREASLQEVPLAVTALSDDTLERLQIEQTADLQKAVPGLKLLPVTSNPSNFQVALRGSTQQDASLVVAESPVGFYVDDVYVARLQGANAQLADLERVEVLRGPQGTLYGRNTLAGAIKLVTRDPGADPYLRLSAGVGEFGQYRFAGAAGGQVGHSFAASLAVLASGNNGFYTNLAEGRDWGAQDNLAVRGKLVFDNDSALRAEFSASYSDSENDGYVPSFVLFPEVPQVNSEDLSFGLGDPFLVNLAPNSQLPPPIEAQPRGDTEQTIVSATLELGLPWATLKSITAYVKTEDFFSVEFTGIGAFPGANGSETDQLSQEFQLQGSALDDRLQWLAGVYLFDEEADQVVALVTSDVLRIDTESVSAYLNMDYQLSERLGLTAGLRWTEDDKSFDGVIRAFGSLAPIAPPVMLNDSYNDVTPKFGLNYQWTDTTLGYLSVSRGFKSGGFNGIAFGNVDVLRTPYDPETNWTYEIGVKSTLLEDRLRINIAAYLNDIEDIALNAQITGAAGVAFPVQNAGDAEVLGLELELVYQPTPGLNLFANLTLQDAEFTRLNPTSTAALAERQFGSVDLQQVSDVSLVVGGSYIFASPFQPGAQIELGADYYYVSDYFSTTANDIEIESFDRASLYTAYRFNEQLEARLEISNLFDSEDPVTGAPVFSALAVAPPRQAVLTVSYRH